MKVLCIYTPKVIYLSRQECMKDFRLDLRTHPKKNGYGNAYDNNNTTCNKGNINRSVN